MQEYTDLLISNAKVEMLVNFTKELEKSVVSNAIAIETLKELGNEVVSLKNKLEEIPVEYRVLFTNFMIIYSKYITQRLEANNNIFEFYESLPPKINLLNEQIQIQLEICNKLLE